MNPFRNLLQYEPVAPAGLRRPSFSLVSRHGRSGRSAVMLVAALAVGVLQVGALASPAAAYSGVFDDFDYEFDPFSDPFGDTSWYSEVDPFGDPFGDSSWYSEVDPFGDPFGDPSWYDDALAADDLAWESDTADSDWSGADDWLDAGPLTNGETSYMVGGTVAASNPINSGLMAGASYQVSIQANGSHECGGTLIAADWVLTAGHCVTHGQSYTAGFGSLAWATGQKISVASTHVNPNYHNPEVGNDLALMKLAEPAPSTLTRALLPDATIGSAMAKAGAPVILTGWGVTTPSHDGQLADQMKVLRLQTLDMAKCKAAVGVGSTEVWVCAGPTDGSTDSPCYGDSGGPLVSNAQGKTHIVGIVSFGHDCVGPALYTNVSKHRSWIENTMAQGHSSPGSSTPAPHNPVSGGAGMPHYPVPGNAAMPQSPAAHNPVPHHPAMPQNPQVPSWQGDQGAVPSGSATGGCTMMAPPMGDPLADFLFGLEEMVVEEFGGNGPMSCNSMGQVAAPGQWVGPDQARYDTGLGDGWSDWGYADPGFGYADPGFGYADPGFGYADPGFGYADPGFGYADPGFGYADPGFGYADSGFGYAGDAWGGGYNNTFGSFDDWAW